MWSLLARKRGQSESLVQPQSKHQKKLQASDITITVEQATQGEGSLEVRVECSSTDKTKKTGFVNNVNEVFQKINRSKESIQNVWIVCTSLHLLSLQYLSRFEKLEFEVTVSFILILILQND